MIKLYHLAEILAIIQIDLPENYLYPLGKFVKLRYREKYGKNPPVQDFGEFKAYAYTEENFEFIRQSYLKFREQIKQLNQE